MFVAVKQISINALTDVIHSYFSLINNTTYIKAHISERSPFFFFFCLVAIMVDKSVSTLMIF
jgi:hypothetical protein